MVELKQLKAEAAKGRGVNRQEALWLYRKVPLDALSAAANRIRAARQGDGFDLCTIINGKGGHCSENCAFCAQSAHFATAADVHSLLPTAAILAEARHNEACGARRFSIVTAGRSLSDDEVAALCETVRVLRQETSLSICVSGGLLSAAQFQQLAAAGVERIHNNLETSARHFPALCTTHTYADKLRAIRDAQAAGLDVCSGGIFGVGESVEDRIDMALALRDLGVCSVPLNMLIAIEGTPLAEEPPLTAEEMQRIVGVYRFILPDVALRLAGGRRLLADRGRACFQGGANALISGDMLTTTGTTIRTDIALIEQEGFKVKKL